jgi:UDP-N-acetylmuramoyl-tripeptide--D-alanyl-D-alanine ligase
MPVHIEFFKSKEQVIDEKMSLPLSLRSNGVAILNADDPNIMSRRDKIKAKVITYGFSEGADVRAENDHVMYEGEGDNAIPTGFAFKVICQGSNVPVRVFGTIGTHLVYPVLAAIAVGVAQGINLVKAIEALADHLPPPGRLHLVPGMNGSTILDDTYNSSPIALEAALTALSELKKAGNGRKIAVIGDMMELGSHTAEAHKKIGEMASAICDEIITVGVRAKFAHEQALAKGFSSERAFHFSNSVEAGEWLKDKINKNDIILVKGSQSARMEKVVVAIMAEPGKRKELLVRQEDEWLNI